LVHSHFEFQQAEALKEMRVREAQRWAESCRLLRQADLVRQGWLFRKRCWLFCQSGRPSVALGRRLESYGLPPASPLEGEVRSVG
jgi:hypothetical protein